MIGLRTYLAFGVIAAVVGYVWFLHTELTVVQSKLANTNAQLSACSARNVNLLEDLKSDREIDEIPDSDLGTVPDRWLLP